MNELVKGNVKVEWVELGEGLSGEYNPNDQNDVELLRFYVSKQTEESWEDIEDASYCTRVPASATPEQRKELLEQIMANVYPRASRGLSIKKICERLSWIGVQS
ncbi:MAG: hypothetical protein ACW99G_15290 [Candidatus Thorarchaeota archaeon]